MGAVCPIDWDSAAASFFTLVTEIDANAKFRERAQVMYKYNFVRGAFNLKLIVRIISGPGKLSRPKKKSLINL